jgi:hypothetical protein
LRDQNCSEPDILKSYNPDKKILRSADSIVVFEAEPIHSASYNGNKDSVMIGIIFIDLYKNNPKNYLYN